MKNKKKQISKFLSYILRHHPEKIQLQLSPQAWANVEELIEQSRKNNVPLTRTLLEEIVEEDNKSRYVFSEDKSKIRACQGHSIKVDLGLQSLYPPEKLYHGTAQKFIAKIKQDGLRPMSRQQVHLSRDIPTAKAVGQRHGRVVLLEIDARKAYEAGIHFYCSENKVWLCNYLPAGFILFP